MSQQVPQRLALSIVQFLSASLRDGSIVSDKTERAAKQIAKAFNVDVADDVQHQQLSIAPVALQSIFDNHLNAATEVPLELSSVNEAEKYKEAGNTHLRKKQYHLAIESYTCAVNLDPTNPIHRSNRAAAHLHLGEHARAVEDARKAIQVGPSYIKAYSRLGHALYAMKDYESSKTVYSLGLILEPSNAQLLAGLELAQSRLSKLGDLRSEGQRLSEVCRLRGTQADFATAIHIQQSISTLAAENDSVWCEAICLLGYLLYLRSERFGSISDLHEAVTNVERAYSFSRTVDNSNRANIVSTLGIVLQSRFARFGDSADLNRAVKCVEEAIALTPKQTQLYSLYLHHLATSLLRRFIFYGKATDLDRSIASSEESVALTPKDPDRHSLLAMSYHSKYTRFGDISHLENAITTFELCLTLLPELSLQRAICLANFGESLCLRFEEKEDITDINRSILLLETSISLVGEGETTPPLRLVRLGRALQTRFHRKNDVRDLERAISYCDEAIRITPDQHPEKWIYILRLGSVLLDRFERSKDDHDLDRATDLVEKAISDAPNAHTELGLARNIFSLALQKKFDRLGDIDFLNRSIALIEDVIETTPDWDPYLPKHLSILAISFRQRFETLNAVADLEKAITTSARSLSLRAGVRLECYILHAELLDNKFKVTGRLEDLDDTISAYSEALRFTSESDDRRTLRVANLAKIARLLTQRFQKLEITSDLDKAISRLEDAVAISVEENEIRAEVLTQLGRGLQIRFEWLRAEGDIHRGVSVVEEAIKLLTEDDPERPTALFFLGSLLRVRFIQFKEPADLEESILFSRQAVDCVKESDPLRSDILSNLGECLHKRFEHHASLVDIDEAILLTRKGIEYIPNGNSVGKARLLNQLAGILFSRYHSLGAPDDIKSAIAAGSEAVSLMPLDDTYRPLCLCTLGMVLSVETLTFNTGFTPHMESLSRSISLFKEALDSIKGKHHPLRPIWKTYLANSLLLRFLSFGSQEDVNWAITMLEETAAELPRGHWYRPTSCNTLSCLYSMRFLSLMGWKPTDRPISIWQTSRDENEIDPLRIIDFALRRISLLGFRKPVEERDATDIDRAISVMSDVIEELPAGHHFQSVFLFSLGLKRQTRFDYFGLESDFVQGIKDFQAAATARGGQIDSKFRAAISWSEFARSEGKLDIAFAGYTTALGFLPLLVWRGLDSELRLAKLEKQTQGLACDAASCAIELGKLEKAVELLELGRSIYWGQASELRVDIAKPRQQNATLANRLEQLGKTLDRGSFGGIFSRMDVTNLDNNVENFHRLAEQWDEVVHEIRQIKEFEDFLLPTPYEKLREAAALGPVIILNVSRFRCDAIIIAPTGQIEAISLPDLKAEDVKRNAIDLETKLKLFSDGKLHASQLDNLTLQPILAWLWTSIGIPLMPHIEHALTLSNSPHRRVWWCPTGYLTFLPIHAAGLYEGEIGMADAVISSYTMNLTTLYRALRKPPREDFRLAVVGVTVVDESQRHLPMVADAVRDIQLLKSTLPFENTPALHGSAANVDAVISEMQKSDWVHFSCHGHQDIQDPMESHLVLHDGPLSVSRIARDELPHLELVHLAACHTASGMASYSDESFHIAAAFQFTGAKGVLATMWAIHDKDGAVVTEKIYKHLFRKNRPHERPDSSEAARALSRAVRHLRRSGASESLHTWVPFIHIGV